MKPCARVLVKMKLLYLAEGLGRVGARPRRAASLRGEQEALLRACPANVPEAGELRAKWGSSGDKNVKRIK